MKNAKKTALLHGLHDGGPVYVEYLRQAKSALAQDIEVTAFNFPAVTRMSSEAVAAILGMPVHDINYDLIRAWDQQDFATVICTDGFSGTQIRESIKAICITHGSVPIPTTSPFLLGDMLTNYDAVATSSHALQSTVAQGISDYRIARKQGTVSAHEGSLRSDLRRTLCMPSLPVKNEKIHATPQSSIGSGKFTVGILPTYLDAIQASTSLYNNLIPILKMLLERFPQCSILFKPYPVDLRRPQIAQLCETLKAVPRLRVADPDLSSSAFYEMSDLIITDGSTGGVSHMLRKTVPPIYFVPPEALSVEVVRRFAASIEKNVLMCHSLKEIEAKVLYLTKTSGTELFKHYQAYCANELFRKQTQQDYFRDILDLRFPAPDAVAVDRDGVVWQGAAEAAE